MEGVKGIDFSNCYYANLSKLLDMEDKDSQDWVLVHAVREMSFERWGGHAFLLNKKTNMILDFSNQKLLEGTKEELFEQWNIQEDGDRMYFEYTKEQCLNKVAEHMTYGSWDLLYEDWMNKEWGKYMKEYFIPNFQPVLNKQRKEKEGVV
tara:strand:+ start:749 stop:1198 length:450 start_codon:yes stop_codon:yes gene_type:complete